MENALQKSCPPLVCTSNATPTTSRTIVPDTIWLEEIGRRGWTAVTHDGRVRYKPNELAAVVQHRVGLLVVIGHAPYPDLARSFVTTKDRIFAFLERHDPPFIAKVYRLNAAQAANNPDAPGSIAPWYPR